MSKLRKPGKNTPKPEPVEEPQVIPLENDPDVIVNEWRSLQDKVVEANRLIKEQQGVIETAQKDANAAQEKIQQINTLGLQVIGQANALHRVLAGMGVDPTTYGNLEGAKNPENSANVAPITLEVPDPKEDKPSPSSTVLRKRFRR